jgi:large subunit ribosomal protein L21
VYAVVQTGGKQYRAEIGQVLTIEKLDVPTGEEVRFDQVLLISVDGNVRVGAPTIEGAVVTGKVVRQDRGPKIIVFKYKPKVRYRRKTGHRQYQTQVLVQTIDGVGRAERPRAETSTTATATVEPVEPVAPSAAPVQPVAAAEPVAPVAEVEPTDTLAAAEPAERSAQADEQGLAEDTQE